MHPSHWPVASCPPVAQAVALSYSWANQLGLGAGVQRWAWVAASSACLMLGAVICRALCDAVEKKGLGDGLGLFIATGTSLGRAVVIDSSWRWCFGRGG